MGEKCPLVEIKFKYFCELQKIPFFALYLFVLKIKSYRSTGYMMQLLLIKDPSRVVLTQNLLKGWRHLYTICKYVRKPERPA